MLLFLVVFKVDALFDEPMCLFLDFDLEIDFDIKLCKNAKSKVLFGLSVFNLSVLYPQGIVFFICLLIVALGFLILEFVL